ncbi:MAG TPA: chromosome partitioning protein [Frankiaceae bacterium]|jgi:MinD-like ATPase involved in chromosome partitioning or flagellar assembly|nr:chromosome partitioning protein [Frankiaceae bacterium]
MSGSSTAFDDGPGDGSSLLTVLTAVAAPSVEAQLVAGFAVPDLGILVVRRCVDLVELLAAAATGTARAALVSADLRGLDRESLAQLASCGVALVGLAPDEQGERLLHQLGAGFVVAAGAPAEQVAGALRAAAAVGPGLASMTASAGGTLTRSDAALAAESPDPHGSGTLLAVWGPAGAPGRTTVALGLADALAVRGVSTLVIDADPYGGSVATLLGLLDEAPGLAAACRAANAGVLDVARLAGCCQTVGRELRVLTGLRDPRRWPELRASALDVVFSLSRWLADVVIVDCGFSMEEDEDLAYDTAAPRRNAATLTALRAADRVLAVGSADPVGLSRLIRDLPKLAAAFGDEAHAPGRVLVVANRLRDGLLPGNPRRQIDDALARHAEWPVFAAICVDPTAADAAHGHGQLLSEAAPVSALRVAFAGLADAVVVPPSASPDARRRLPGRRPGRRRRGSVPAG